ncbi:glucose-6-phosphate isomerase, partial [Candidatus Desantisbacteria bacterium]|nr:glucose-6-phosphate isomerase [Candidatus Desantisbacteria bacterium]
LAGARAMNKICMNDSLWENPAAMSATLQYLFYNYKKMNMVVLMPYSSKLKNLAEWFRQLWAESLGKKYSIDGDTIFAGSTPIDALGVTDQHSQLQLYTEGPYDKTIVFIKVGKFTSEIKIPKEKKSGLQYLGGHTLNKLMDIEFLSTEYSLLKEKRPSSTIHIPEINDYTIGQLLYFLEMQTVIAGELFRVNTYNQPGVETGKNFTYGLLHRKGYEDKVKEFAGKMEKSPKYII